MSRYRQPTTQEQALYLALVAPGDGERQAAEILAVEYAAAGLDETTIAIARAAATERYESEVASL